LYFSAALSEPAVIISSSAIPAINLKFIFA
jgi:hypothetical protein